ncbi:MAG TPA: class I SAM-dependent methyltransferase [Bacteroidia bacterium]|jgi:ubiquinone/menaquinone biosynthesis C-methylase UbiE|nr:class I SAM-dependent methyltransferase [Bacteroidia bacterium]
MNEIISQEQNVSEAFSRQAVHFDNYDLQNPVIQRMRKQVHTHLLSLLNPGDQILELNSGTGIDAIFLARNNFSVHATDNAEGMLKMIKQKITALGLEKKISLQKCSFNDLEDIKGKKFDHIFSNFGGLNCSENIDIVIKQFEDLLKPGGRVTLVIMPTICPWELLLALKGNFRTAFRRLTKKGVRSHLEGIYFDTYYYSARRVLNAFDKKLYEKICIKGLAILSPPPYLDKFCKKYPKIFKMLCRAEEKIDQLPPFNSWADHFIISMRKMN